MTARAGRREYEELLFEQLPLLHSVAHRMTRNRADAEDLVQETSLRGYRFFDRFESGTNFRAWIVRILKNLFINEWHRRRAEPQAISLDALESQDDAWERHAGDLFRLASLGDPEAALEQALLREDIDAAMEGMAPEYRMVVTLCLVEGFSYNEAADALDVPVGTVMSRLFRGRKHLQARLMEHARARGFGSPAGGTEPSA